MRSGTEPATARSVLGLRLALSAVFLPLFAAATAAFALWAVHQGPGDSPGSGASWWWQRGGVDVSVPTAP
ncbi:DUF6343 family protein [Streptomyces sp. NPDC054834]